MAGHGVDEYLEIEYTSPIRHEYIDGVMYAMVGYSRRHGDVAGNLYVLLRARRGDSRCRVYQSGMKVRTAQTSPKAADAEVKTIEIPGPMRSFGRMAAIAPDVRPEDVMASVARRTSASDRVG